MTFKRIAASLGMAALGMTMLAQTALGATYSVKSGDSLWSIATKYGTTTQTLMSTNGLTSTMIMPGQQLRVPGPDTYAVQGSDTMWIISQKLHVTLGALIAANKQIADPSSIWPGLVINVPAGGAVPVAAPAAPDKFTGGLFPLAKGTYQAFTDNYADDRTFAATGGTVRKHEGVDIFAPKGTPIYSAMEGDIINFGWSELGGWRVTVRVTGGTYAFYYAHLSKYADGIGKGTHLKAGQLIGYVGNTGYGPEGTSGKFEPHLHFGIYQISPWTSIDPYTYLKWWAYNQK